MSILDTNIAIYDYFEKIAQIPHGSYHEEGIADFIESVAIEHELRYVRDEMNNIVIYKNASQGYENHPTIMLQGHMDMVNEKNNESEHDFDNDPLELYIEDEFLHASGTTLGADDGCGICYMLAILTDQNLKHPSLECVFTVQEEVGLCGAIGLDASLLSAKRMIGLDSGTEGQTCTSSSGGNDVLITKPITGEDNYSPVYVLEITGLLGGHSGSCIDKARGNANKIAARILYYLLKEGMDIRLIEITGGLKNNAIPRECYVAFASTTPFEYIQAHVESYEKDIQMELENSDPELQIHLYEDECDVCISAQDSEAIISLMYLAPNGLIEKSQVIKDLTTLSLNMGIVRTHEDSVTISYSIRSPLQTAREDLALHLELIASVYNAYIEVSHDYPGWDYDSHSQLRKQLREFYQQRTGHSLKEVATHGGLETGVFKGKIPDLDIITMGPDMDYIHTPDERLNLESYLRTYQLLIDFIATL